MLPLDVFFVGIVFTVILFITLLAMRGNSALKVIVVTAAVVLSVYSVYSIQQWKGFPAEVIPNKEMSVVGINIQKPDHRGPGGIFLTVYDGNPEPRLIRIPYTEDRDKDMQDKKKKLANGVKIVYNPEGAEKSDKVKKEGRSFSQKAQDIINAISRAFGRALPDTFDTKRVIEIDPREGIEK